MAVGVNLIRLANAPLGSVGAEQTVRIVSFTHSPHHPRPAHRAARDRRRRRGDPLQELTSTRHASRNHGDRENLDEPRLSGAGASCPCPEVRLPRANRSFISAIATARASSTPTGRSRTIEEAIKDQSGLLWVDIQGPDEHTGTHLENWLCEHFHFHRPGRRGCTPGKRTFPR